MGTPVVGITENLEHLGELLESIAEIPAAEPLAVKALIELSVIRVALGYE